MPGQAEELVAEYLRWLKDKTQLRAIEGSEWTEILTPYLDRNNDYIAIYLKSENDQFLLSDGGETIADLSMCGCELDSPRRQELLNLTLNGFGIKLDGDALTTHATKQNFPVRKHNLIQSILSVNDLFYVSQPSIRSLFIDDVRSWLKRSKVRFVQSVKFSGTSGYDHRFDFAIPESDTNPERLVRVINNPTRDTVEAMAFAWVDTKEARSIDTKAFAILNDTERRMPSNVEDALKSYDITPVNWSNRDADVSKFAA